MNVKYAKTFMFNNIKKQNKAVKLFVRLKINGAKTTQIELKQKELLATLLKQAKCHEFILCNATVANRLNITIIQAMHPNIGLM